MKTQTRPNTEIVEELLARARESVRPSSPLNVFLGHPENIYLVSEDELSELRFAARGSVDLRSRTDYPISYSKCVWHKGYLFAANDSNESEQAVA